MISVMQPDVVPALAHQHGYLPWWCDRCGRPFYASGVAQLCGACLNGCRA